VETRARGPHWIRTIFGSAFDRVEMVVLDGAGVDSASIRQFCRSGRPRELWLNDTAIGDADLQALTSVDSIEFLSLERTAITDDGARYLSSVKSLRGVSLMGTCVSNTGISYFAALPGLEYLNVVDTAVTDTAVLALQRALPQTLIER